MTVLASAMMPRFGRFARYASAALILCVSLLVSACGGGGPGPTPSPETVSTLNAFALTVSTTGSGSVTSTPGGIDCGNSCSASYASGTSVTLTATPKKGNKFSDWGGKCRGNSTKCTISITDTSDVTATFTPDTVNYILSVSVSGSGTVSSSPSGIDCGSSCSASYADGTSVTLTAAAASGYSFAGWSRYT